MTDLNHVVLIGNLTKGVMDDERSFGYVGQTAKATVSLAVNRSIKKNEQWVDEVSFFDINIWGKTAENLKPYLVKGKQVCVEGYLKQERWEKDGQKFSKIVINASNVRLFGGKKEENTTTSTSQQTFNPSDGFPEDCPF